MSSTASSESTQYRPRRRGVVAASSSCTAGVGTGGQDSDLTVERIIKAADPSMRETLLRTPNLVSQVHRQSNFLSLVRCISNALFTLQSYGFSIQPSIQILDKAGPPQFIGRGKTFYVSRIQLPDTVELQQSWPSKLVLRLPVSLYGGVGYKGGMISCKRPLIEFDCYGNPKDHAAEERLNAVLLEVQVLTHPPLYLHKNIVDFLGVDWESDLSEFEPGQPISGPTKRVPSVLLEHAQHGSLEDFRYTKSYTTMSFERRAILCREVAEGLAALHRCGVVHGDVKLNNILIFDGGASNRGGIRAKLADFGFSVKRCKCCDIRWGGGANWRLQGRTWPWNAPEWSLPRTWTQLEKTDVFSYGLLVWTVLTGKELGSLFDLGKEDVNRNDPGLREMVEKMKDWTLSWNAASYFRGGDKLVELLVECLFECSLSPVAEKRGTMEDILDIWNTWFIQDPPYQSLPPGVTFAPMDIKDSDRIQFQAMIRNVSAFPPIIKKQLLSLYGDPSLSYIERFEATVFRAFAHLMGWGIEQSTKEGKRLIDEAAKLSPNAALFQLMFFEPEIATTEYWKGVRMGLITGAFKFNIYEIFPQLSKHFPMPKGMTYTRLRSGMYRKWKYGIKEYDYPIHTHTVMGADLCALQLDDIERNSRRESVLKRGHNQLHFAVFSGFTEATEWILESEDFHPSLLEEQDCIGNTPLLAACQHGKFAIAELLIMAGANVKARNHHEETALHFLTEFNNSEELIEITDLIIALGGKELIHVDCAYRSYEQEDIIVMPFMKGPPLVPAVLRGNAELVKALLKNGADPRHGVTSSSPLELAAAGHFTELLRLFWEAFPGAKEWRNCQLLLYAITGFTGYQRKYFHAYRTREMMESTFDFLLDKAAGSPLKIDNYPLLSIAAKLGSAEILEYIILKIGPVEINTYHHAYTPLHEAIESGSDDKFRVLLKYGADPHAVVGPQAPLSSLYQFSISLGATRHMIESLVEHGVGRGDDGKFPRIFVGAICANNIEIASILLDAGADIDEENHYGWTALGSAIRSCSVNSVAQLKFLLDHQTAIGKKPASFLANPEQGFTPLHTVAYIPAISPSYDRATMSDILDYLLGKFYSPEHLNARDNHGRTALYIALCSGNAKVVQRLLDFGIIDLDLHPEVGDMTAHGYALDRAMSFVPKAVQELGYHAVKLYKEDRMEIVYLLEKRLFPENDFDPEGIDFGGSGGEDDLNLCVSNVQHMTLDEFYSMIGYNPSRS